MTEYIEKKKKLFFEGVELADFYAKYPSFCELETINSFFERLAEGSYAWFCEKFYEKLTKEYTENPDLDKRFKTVAYKYKIIIDMTENNGDILLIKCKVTLTRGRREEVARYEGELYFNKESQLLIPARRALKKKK